MRVKILGLVLLNATLIFFTPVLAAGATDKKHIQYPEDQEPNQVEGENSVPGNTFSAVPSIHVNLALECATVMRFYNRVGTGQAPTNKLK